MYPWKGNPGSQTVRTHPRAWLILALILAAEIMDLLDSTIVNVAAPSIARDLGSSSSALQSEPFWWVRPWLWSPTR